MATISTTRDVEAIKGSSLLSPDMLAAAQLAAATGFSLESMQHLALLQLKNDKIPEPFLWPEEKSPSLAYEDFGEETIPVIDLQGVEEEASTKRASLAREVAEACERWGFFQVINHGISQDVVESARKEARNLFGLPHDRKLMAMRQLATSHSGYGTNVSVTEETCLPWSEAFTVMGRPHHTTKECSMKLWPSEEMERNRFCSAIEAYLEGMKRLSLRIVELLVEGLGVEDGKHFEEIIWKNPHETLRMNFYPVCPQPSRTVGLNSHTDTNCITIVHDGGIGGLQVLGRDGKSWVAIRPRQDAFAINIGDMFEVLSNGRYKSVLHRAVVNECQERMSMAYFVAPPAAARMVPSPHLINQQHPARYKPFTWAEYYCSRRILCNTKSLNDFLI